VSAGVNDANDEADKELNPVTEICGVNDCNDDAETEVIAVTEVSDDGDIAGVIDTIDVADS